MRDKKWYKQKKEERRKERKDKEGKKKKENGAIKNQIDLLQASCIVIHFLIFKKGLRKKKHDKDRLKGSLPKQSAPVCSEGG